MLWRQYYIFLERKKKYQFEKIDEFQNKKYTYLKNVVLKNENCSINTRFCGIVDDEENKLCLPISSECPPNVISTIKLNKSNYYTSIIDNKTVYYTFDENEINNKIIAGLYVETDIYINKEEENENNMILDTYSINGLLKDNYLLYRGIDLGYNPYEIDNIDEKGKSYLKVRHYTKRPNLASMRKQKNQYIIDISMNIEVIIPIRSIYKLLIIGIIGCIFLFVEFFYFICKKEFNFIVSIFIELFLLFFIIPYIISCMIINKFNKAKDIDPENNFKSIRILNLIFIILTSLLYLLYLVIFLFFCLKKKIIKEKEVRINSFNDSEQKKCTNILKSNASHNK